MKPRTTEVAPDEIRDPVVAGQFYPDDAEELRNEIALFLRQSGRRRQKFGGEVIAGVVPHAGYVYSGAVASKFYALLAGAQLPLVVVISPSHRERFAAISLFGGMAYRTPLGDVRVNRPVVDEIVGRGAPFINDWRGHLAEHALEVQLPFLQTLLPQAEIVPIVMGDQHPEFCEQLGTTLAELLHGRRALILASSDLSHYHTHVIAKRLDGRVLHCVRKLAPERLLDTLEQGRAEACGGGPIVSAMIAARRLGATAGHVLDYRDSSAVSGDENNVVGYLAAAFYKA
jgi:hypothetical protein